jgi:hypothetical protein
MTEAEGPVCAGKAVVQICVRQTKHYANGSSVQSGEAGCGFAADSSRPEERELLKFGTCCEFYGLRLPIESCLNSPRPTVLVRESAKTLEVPAFIPVKSRAAGLWPLTFGQASHWLPSKSIYWPHGNRPWCEP